MGSSSDRSADFSSEAGSQQDSAVQGTSPQHKPEEAAADPESSSRDASRREDVRAARLETRLRRWALFGFIIAAALFWLVTLFLR